MTDHGRCQRCLDEPVDPDFTDLGLGRRCADDWSHAAEKALHDRLVRALGDDERDDLPVDELRPREIKHPWRGAS